MTEIERVDISLYSGIASDSRQVKQNYIFICIKGLLQNGHDFVNDAIKNGASLIIAEDKIETKVPVIVCKDSRLAAVYLSDKFYSNPSDKLKIVGITGTNGKSSCSFLTHRVLTKLGYKAGVIGTGKYLIGTEEFTNERTTPDIIELRYILSKMVEAKVEFVLMEVSSHAIALQRVAGIKFDFVCFTNLSQDHLDFHKTFENYVEIKINFLKNAIFCGSIALINWDDEQGKILDSNKILKISSIDKKADYYYKCEKSDLSGIKFYLNDLSCSSSLLGEINLFNSAFILSLLDVMLGKVFTDVLQGIKPLEGRYNLIRDNVLVDYAHSPDSLQKVLQFAKKLGRKRIITLFGCGGNRDRDKRKKMGKIAVGNSDLVIVCEDNSRKENVVDIVSEIADGNDMSKIVIIKSRKIAITYGLSISKEEDIFLVLGRGAEKKIDRGFEVLPFSDLEYLSGNLDNSFKQVFDPLWVEKVLNSSFGGNFSLDFVFERVVTDSRNLEENSLFIALPGKNFDSNQFVRQVLETQGCCAVVNKECEIEDDRVLVVEDTVDAYQSLAKAYLSHFDPVKIGITGSVGKTTTKEILSNVLSQDGKVLKTFANENNQIGVPKTIFRLTPSHKYLLIEMGTDHPGEIEKLASVVCPNIGIITNVSASHLQAFRTIKGVYQEKKRLFDYSDIKLTLAKEFFDESLDFDIIEKDENVFVKIDKQIFELGNQPRFRADAAAIAVKVGMILSVDNSKISKGLSQFLDLENRLEIKNIDGVDFIFDCYNANPLSMRESIKFWKNYKKNRNHIAILGDMLELGDKEIDFHAEIGKFVTGYTIFGVGRLSKHYNPTYYYGNVDRFCENLPKFSSGDVVLIKGSNGVGLTKLKKILESKSKEL